MPSSIGCNSRTEKCLGTKTNGLIRTPTPPPPKKNALSVRCRKKLRFTNTHMKNEYLIILYWTAWQLVWEEKYCNPLINNSSCLGLMGSPPPPPPSHTQIYPINLRTFRTRPLRSHNQFLTNFLTGRFGWDGNHADLELILLASMARSSGKGI